MSAPILFDELLDALRREGFSVGTDQYLRMHALLERHAGASPEQLKTLLCPLFAMRAAEQERFHVAYNEFFAAAQAVPKHTSFRGTTLRRITVMSEKLPAVVEAPPPRAVRWKVILAFTIAIVTMVMAIPFFQPDPAAPEPEPEVTSSASEVIRNDRPVVPDDPSPSPRPQWVLAAGSLAFALFAAEVARTLLRWLRQRRHRAKGRPFDWAVRDPHPTAPRLFADQRFFGIARLMKGREVGDVRRLDVPRSILATIRALGDPAFEYRLDRRVMEYLFLVERRSERDHLALYVHAMIQALERDGVLVEVFEHDGDPRHCWKPGSSVRIPTVDLHSRFPQHRLVIVGNGLALTNPVTGEALDSIARLFPWNYRAILTPEDETRGVARFDGYFDVYALAENGLARLAERWQQTDAPPQRRRSKERQRIITDLPSSPDELECELEPLIFRWLLRCAVHPTLHWDLTRELAPPLPAAEHEAALLELARLEWFRQGRIPEPARLALVSRLSLDEPEEATARASAMRVLAASPPPPPGTMAAHVFEIQQLAHRIWGARDQPAELRPLIRKLRHYPPSQVARDGALMMLLREAPGTLVTHTLPQPLRNFLFRDGIPAFGMKNFVVLTAVLPVMLFGGDALRKEPQTATAPVATQPPVAAMQPPVVDTPPPVLTTQPPVVEAKPPVVEAKPPVAEAKPPVAEPKPPVIVVKRPPVIEPPKAVRLPDLPKLIAPSAGTVITMKNAKEVITFRWQPAGDYTLRVVDSSGKAVHVAKVRGTSASWRVTSASSAKSWSLTTTDGRVTAPVPFGLEAGITFDDETVARLLRTVEVKLPVTCGTTAGKYPVNLRLSARETFETAELKVLNAGEFETAEVSTYDAASFNYRFIVWKGCTENKLQAHVRVTATIRMTLPSSPP
jgi:hypothetical protein